MNLYTLRTLAPEQLPRTCAQLRKQLIEDVGRTGGHLGGSLGVVELTVAIHYLFDTPHDQLVWDVGHQAYIHKLLTGRSLDDIRQLGGISGFPKREESEFDAFGTGHSSTSISAALGMAIADKKRNADSRKQHIAVIGDGALTAGMAYEALHHAAVSDVNLLIIINENAMSISPNVGGMVHVLSNSQRACAWFSALGLSYIGVLDGHNLSALIETLTPQTSQTGARVVHIRTEKGRGYEVAKNDITRAHAIKAKKAKSTNNKTYSEYFGDWLCDKARQDKNLHVITPAMVEGSGLSRFAELFPNQLSDVGIAEQHAVTLAAGMACAGLKPVVAIYSTFLQRGYDQLIHDIALQNLDVMFAIDRAGIVGEDGATHTGAFDIAFTRAIPNLNIVAPASVDDFRLCLTQCYEYPAPTLIRYPKGNITKSLNTSLSDIAFGKADIVRKGQRIAILVFGTLIEIMQPVADALDATLVNMRYVKPLDIATLKYISQTHMYIVTLEEGCVMGGIGEFIASFIDLPTLSLGLPDKVIPHGTRAQVLDACGLSQTQLQTRIEKWLNTYT